MSDFLFRQPHENRRTDRAGKSTRLAFMIKTSLSLPVTDSRLDCIKDLIPGSQRSDDLLPIGSLLVTERKNHGDQFGRDMTGSPMGIVHPEDFPHDSTGPGSALGCAGASICQQFDLLTRQHLAGIVGSELPQAGLIASQGSSQGI